MLTGGLKAQNKVEGGYMEGGVYSCAKKGFAISSSPSTGLRSVIVGPRRTVRPRERV